MELLTIYPGRSISTRLTACPVLRTRPITHPLFLYESLWNLANMFFLLWLGRRFASRLLPGDLFLSYLVTYPLARFLLEFIRLDTSQVAGVNANQIVMLVMVIAASALIGRHRPSRRLKPTTPTPEIEI